MQNFNLASGRGWQSLLCICLIAVLIGGKTRATDENNQKPSKANHSKRKSSSSYCGVYGLYTVMKLSGRKINFLELVKPEYISSRKGSSLYTFRALPAEEFRFLVLDEKGKPIPNAKRLIERASYGRPSLRTRGCILVCSKC